MYIFKILRKKIFNSVAATIDVKRNIYDLSINTFDSQIALVENQGMYHSIQESVVRIYDVGRRRDDDDEQVRNLNFILYTIYNKFYLFRKRKTTKKIWMVPKMEVVLILVPMITMVSQTSTTIIVLLNIFKK